MKGHAKKMIAPIVVTVLATAYFAALAFLSRNALIALVAAALAAALIWMTAERIREIRSGEEDDLDNY